jgi:citronellol/citronellal dehydrogenase
VASLRDKTLFITGASRGIGRAIALRAAADGANVVIAAKSTDPHPELPGTIHSVATEVEAAGGRALGVAVDLRFEDQIEAGVERAIDAFGGIDVVVNNAGAISLTSTLDTGAKRFDLLMAVNVRATYLCTRACAPHLKYSDNPHVLILAPPPSLDPKWLAPHLAYSLSKYGMSLCVIGMAAEFESESIGVNALWPKTVIATAALSRLKGLVARAQCRRPEIVADAAHAIVTRDSHDCTGNFFIDEEVLVAEGVTDFERYAVEPGRELRTDLFLEPD